MKMNMPFRLVLVLACLTAFVGCKTNLPATALPQSAVPGEKSTCVIVHGAWGGGWDWKSVDQLLTADGYKVYRPTLTGQGEHSNLASTNIDLDTHIQDIVNVIVWEDLRDVVLVGHSYGGMVITGVADRVPDRIRRLVYVDALLPENGENVDTIISPKLKKPVKDGFVTCPWVVGTPAAAARCPYAGQNLQRTHLVDQPGCCRKTARDIHSYRGQGQPAGAGRFLSILPARPDPGLDHAHHGRRPQCPALASEGTRRAD